MDDFTDKTEDSQSDRLDKLTARVEVLETRRSTLKSAEYWLLQDAHKLALARRGYDRNAKGKLEMVAPENRTVWIECCERAVSRSVDLLADAAMADGLGTSFV